VLCARLTRAGPDFEEGPRACSPAMNESSHRRFTRCSANVWNHAAPTYGTADGRLVSERSLEGN